MGKSREIKQRIKAVRNIQRITRTMQMIATSKFSRAQQAAEAGRPYARTLLDLVGELAAGEGVSHPLLGHREEGTGGSGRELTLIVTSERGLCGPYNGNVVRTGIRHLAGLDPARGGSHRLEVIGKKGVGVLRFSRFAIDEQIMLGDRPEYGAVERVASRYIGAYASGEVDAVSVVSMQYLSAGRQVPRVLRLLPFAPASGEGGGASLAYEFSPEGGALLDALLPAAVKALLFQAVNEAIVSEHIARMVAMKSATDNAKKMGKALKTKFNRARQSQITTELTEIVSGAAALA